MPSNLVREKGTPEITTWHKLSSLYVNVHREGVQWVGDQGRFYEGVELGVLSAYGHIPQGQSTVCWSLLGKPTPLPCSSDIMAGASALPSKGIHT